MAPEFIRIEFGSILDHSGYGLSQRETISQCNVVLGWAQYPELSLSIIPHDALGAGFATLSRDSLYPINITHGSLCFSYFLYHLWICGTNSSISDRVVSLALGWPYVWSSAKRVFPNDMINDSQVYSVLWVSKIKPIISIIFAIYGTLRFQFTHFSCADWEDMRTLSYYHHQIRSMKQYPLSGIRSWNNVIHCMSCV